VSPGYWLRLCALGGAHGTLLAVVTGVWDLGTGHAVLAALALPPLAAVVAASWVEHRRLLAPSLAALVLFGLAAAITAPGLHLTLAGLAFAASLVTTALAFRGRPEPAGSWRDYVTLTKPRIMTLLLLTGICGMFIGERGVPPLWLVGVTALGLGLACGGASALNHVLDADIDKLMGKRTRSRPVAAGRVPATYALEFGLALSALSFVLLAGLVNVLTAARALLGNLFYVFVYTRWLKRTTPQNIVIGGAAGAFPPLVGWAAMTGTIDLTAVYLFLIVFYWTPPHFWALALLKQRDYGKAGIPMAPLVWGERETMRQMAWYNVILIALTLLPATFGAFGMIYLVSALVLGAILLVGVIRVSTADDWTKPAWRVYKFSLLYLALLFLAMVIDRKVLG
jgi:heme o synthase